MWGQAPQNGDRDPHYEHKEPKCEDRDPPKRPYMGTWGQEDPNMGTGTPDMGTRTPCMSLYGDIGTGTPNVGTTTPQCVARDPHVCSRPPIWGQNPNVGHRDSQYVHKDPPQGVARAPSLISRSSLASGPSW